MDALLSHEASEATPIISHDNDNILFILHTFILYRKYFFNGYEESFKPNVVPTIQTISFLEHIFFHLSRVS